MSEFDALLVELSGNQTPLAGISPEETLHSLHNKVAIKFGTSLPAVKLVHNGVAFQPEQHYQTLQSLGIGQGTELTFVRLPIVAVTLGTKIKVEGAGMATVNGVYTCVTHYGGRIISLQKDGNESASCISWHPENKGRWPAGWYLQRDNCSAVAHYFVLSDDNSSLPVLNWTPYIAETYSAPGDEPAPTLHAVVEGAQ